MNPDLSGTVDYRSSLFSQYQTQSGCADQMLMGSSPTPCNQVCVTSVKYNGDTASPYAGTSPATNGTLRSSQLSLQLFAYVGAGPVSSLVPVSNLAVPMYITFGIRPVMYAPQPLHCMYWNTTTQAWATDGVAKLVDFISGGVRYVTCTSTHMTDFGVFEQCPPGYLGLSFQSFISMQ